MPRVLLAGAFGQRNPGDDALLSAFTAALPGWDPVVPAADPAAVRGDDRLTPIPNTGRRTLAALAGCDAVVFAGGTVFKLLGPGTGRGPLELLLRGAALARAARTLGKPVALAGVGAAALPGGPARGLARRLAAAADLLVVRDDESADLLAAAGVPVPIRVGADAAWTLFPPVDEIPPVETGALTNAPGRTMVVTTSRHGSPPAAIPRLAAGIARFASAHPVVTGVRIEPWQVGGPGVDDLDLARRLADALRVAGAPDVTMSVPPESVPAAAAAYRDAALVLGSRFHSLLAAAAAGTRFVAVDHEAKLGALAGRLQQPAVPPDSGVSTIAGALSTAFAGPPPSRDAAAAEQRAAGSMLGLLRSVLEHGTSGSPAALHALTLRPEALIR
jgi:polysaccharide pyruvyl transferase WcaK-like protein